MASLIGVFLWALLPGFIAQSKGRSFGTYFLLSFLITPLITTIITLCLPKIEDEPKLIFVCENCSQKVHADLQMKGKDCRCPECGALMVEKGLTTDQKEQQVSHTWTCMKCGHENKVGQTKCENCGKS